MPASPMIEARDILKIYPNGVRAVDFVGVGLAVVQGEIHAVIGENGAGKSTLMKILYGLEHPTRGQIEVRGKPVSIRSPQDAIRLGIGMVHQHFMLIPSFTVAQNVVLNAEPRRGLHRQGRQGGLMVDPARARAVTQALAERYGLNVAPDAPVGRISVGMRQRVEILKALYRGADLLILDEPTAVLTPGETRDLFGAIRTLVSQGKTVIFITHKLREVKEIADRVMVMRDGSVIGTVDTNNADARTLARMMVGREMLDAVQKPPARRGKPVLNVHDLTCVSETGKPVLDRVSFEVHEGEILGIAGIEGNGQTELVEVLTGLRAVSSVMGGMATLDDQAIGDGDPRRAREAGIAHIPEDRLTNGAAADASIRDNLIVDRYYQPPYRRHGLLYLHAIQAHVEALIRRFGIMASSSKTDQVSDMALQALSGGNMQKVIVARELSSQPRLLVAAQPTRGIDVGAMEFIHQQLIDKRGEGLAILLVSADLQEVLKLSDRLLVMYNGRIVARFSDPASVAEDELGLYMVGAKSQQDTGQDTAAS